LLGVTFKDTLSSRVPVHQNDKYKRQNQEPQPMNRNGIPSWEQSKFVMQYVRVLHAY